MRELTAKAHDLLSGSLLLPLSGLQRRFRPATRHASRALSEGLRFRQNAENWSQDEKRDSILTRLRFVVRRAARTTVYYQRLFKQTGFDPYADFGFEEFSQLPLLERDDINRGGRDLVSSDVAASMLRRDATGGSSGTPTEVWLGPEDRGWGASGIDYFMGRINVPPGTRTGYLWGHHLDPVDKKNLSERYRAFESNTSWFDCFRLSPETLEKYHQAFERRRPACIIAYANALGSLAEYVLERNHKPHYPTKCFVTGAEKLWPKHREAITEAFGRPVHERYGSRDVGAIGIQLDPAQTLDYAIDWANILLEPETNEEVSAILVTKLHADGMPMLRYKIGDLGRFSEDHRPANPTFVLPEVLGRTTDRIWLPSGNWVTGLQMPHMMKDYPIREFMFLQKPDYSIEISVVPKNGFSDDSRKQILSTVAANLPGLQVRIVEVESIPRTKANKLRPVVSEVQPTGVTTHE
jgi:phenylacetate-CoA ligase